MSKAQKKMIQLFSNSLGRQELKAVERVFGTRWVGMGKECRAFEEAFASHLGTQRCLLVNNCTAGIYIALKSLGIGRSDEVIISTVNFVATAGAVVELGAKPVFADVDERYLNIIPDEIERLRTRKTKAVFLLHYGGHPVRFDDIVAACGGRLKVFEDSANSIDSTYHNRHCGTLGDAAVFSFDAMKTLVMCDGGAVVFKDQRHYQKALPLRYLGLVTETRSGFDTMGRGNQRWWEYDLETVSGRFISNDALAAIGRVQLARLEGFVARRKKIWQYYQREFSKIAGIEIPPEPLAATTSSYYLYWIKVGSRRDSLAKYLIDKGIYCSFRYFPLHLVPYYRSEGVRLPHAEKINKTTLNIPLHQNLSDSEVDYIVSTVRSFFRRRR